MPGGGIRSKNAQKFIDAGIFPEVHSAGILQGEMADKKEIQQLVEMLK